MVNVRKRRPSPRVVRGKSGASYGTTQGKKGKAAQQKFRKRTQKVGKIVKGVFSSVTGVPHFIPQAEAASPTGLVVKGVGTAAKFVVKSATIQPLGKTTPLRGSTIKSETYLNQVRSGVMPSTGGGVPKFPGYPDTFAVMQSGKVDTRLLNVAGINKPNVAGGTRTYQAAVTGGPGSVKHQVKKKSFVKIKAGGPVMEFPGGTKTRFRKRSYQTVTTPSTLVQGQDPLTKKVGLDAFMATGAVAAPVAATGDVGFWDQFNPFPQAHAAPAGPTVSVTKAIVQRFIANTPGAKWDAFKAANQDLVSSGKVTKTQFLKDLKLTQKVGKPGGADPRMQNKISDRRSVGLLGLSTAGGLGLIGASSQIAPWLDEADYSTGGAAGNAKWEKYAEMQDAARLGAGAGATTTITSPSELVTDTKIPGQATLEERTIMQETALLNLGFDAKGNPMPSGGVAGPAPTVQYGMPSEQGKADPNYTLIRYNQWDGKKMVEASQWMKLGMGGNAESMTRVLNRQALIKQTNTVYIEAQTNIREAVSKNKTGNALSATAKAAKKEYARIIEFGGAKVPVSSVIGQLPQQYQTILARDSKAESGMAQYKAAIAWQSSAPVFTEYADHPGKGITVTPSGYTPETTTSDKSTSSIHSDK